MANHLDDAQLQQFVSSKTQRPLQLAYEVQRIDNVEVGVLWIPVQERPFFLKKDFGRLKKDTVYLRHGSSTSTADPDEIARIAVAVRPSPSPQLSVQARVLNSYRGSVVVTISNDAGAGDARAPYLQLIPPGPFQLSPYGPDGTSRQHGLPLLAQAEGSIRVQFAGTADVVLHPGTSRDVAVIEWHGAQDKVPTTLELPYIVGAAGVQVAKGKLTIELGTG